MYLHLGRDVVIRTEDIVGIFDLETSTLSDATRGCLAAAQKAGRVVDVSDGLPKSFVLCRPDQGPPTVYTSQISTATLLRRSGFSGGKGAAR